MDPYEQLKACLLNYDSQGTRAAAQEIVDQGLDTVSGLGVVMDALREVGEGYAREELWLPDLVVSANTAQAALPILEAELKRTGKTVENQGTVVIGTVYGDLHSIGKTMVNVMMSARGFKMIDLGTNIHAEQFVAAVREHTPDILALSALLTTTAPEQGKVIQALEAAGLRTGVKIMVGGGAITPEFARTIGADGYGATAPEAASVALELLGVPATGAQAAGDGNQEE